MDTEFKSHCNTMVPKAALVYYGAMFLASLYRVYTFHVNMLNNFKCLCCYKYLFLIPSLQNLRQIFQILVELFNIKCLTSRTQMKSSRGPNYFQVLQHILIWHILSHPNPRAAKFFLYPTLGTELIFNNPSPCPDFFLNVYCLARTFFFDIHVSGLRIEAPLHAQYRISVYTLF